MTFCQNSLWFCVSAACLVLGSSVARAQDLQAQMRKQSSHMPGPPKPEADRPGPMKDRHPGGPKREPDERNRHEEPRKPPHDAGVHHHAFGDHRDRDAGPNATPWSDAGVRHHRGHRTFTPEQQAKRKEHLTKLREQYGRDTFRHVDAKAELSVHAWRIARLERMRSIAIEQKKAKLVERIDALIQKENERHNRRLQRLREAHGDKSGAPTPLRPSAQPTLGGHP